MFKGYRGRRAGSVADGCYLTDDEGCFDAEGRLRVIGRRDRLIITGGEKVDPLEVEQALRRTGAVQEVLVLGWPDPEWGHRVVAFYTGSAGAPARSQGSQESDDWGGAAACRVGRISCPNK